MSLLDDLKKILEKKKTASPQEQNQFMEQLKNERALFDRFKNAGLPITADDLQGRARLRPEGILSLIEKVNLIDLITKITEITTIKTLENLTNVDLIKEVRLIQDKAALDSTDIDVQGFADTLTAQLTEIMNYTVPAGSTLLIYDWAAMMTGSDTPLRGYLYNKTTFVRISVAGGSAGFQTPFSKPKRIDAGEQVSIVARQNSGANQNIYAHFGGILI